MALDENVQIKKALDRSASILVTFPDDPTLDSAASALALARCLKKMGKRIEVVSAHGNISAQLKFLPDAESVKPTLEEVQKLTIELPVSEVPVKELSYEVRDGKLCISIVPKQGNWKPEHVSARAGKYRYDLVCTVGCQDLHSLGPLFEKHSEFFYNVPIINFDHDPSNEHFGQINYVDINAAANGELLYHLLKDEDELVIDEHAATALLTGIIAKTRSFKTPNVGHRTLSAASELVARGAKHDQIVHHIYRTRTVPILRLWGRALARLRQDTGHGIAWTLLGRQDFVLAGADPKELHGVLDELLAYSSEARIGLVVYEDPAEQNFVRAAVHSKRPLSAKRILADFNPEGGHELARISFGKISLPEAESKLLAHIKAGLASR